MKFAAALLLTAALGIAGAQEVPRITFSKSFPGSTPAFFLITVERTGASSYNESQDPDNAEKTRGYVLVAGQAAARAPAQ